MNKSELLDLGFIDEVQYKEACAALNNPDAKPHGMTGLFAGSDNCESEYSGESVAYNAGSTSGSTYYTSSGSYPSSYDLTPMMPPVYDQGDRGTCVAQAGTALMEFYFGPEHRLSQQFLYWIMKTKDESERGEPKLREWRSHNPPYKYEDFLNYFQKRFVPYEHKIYDNPEKGYRSRFSGSNIFSLERALREYGICDYDLMPYSPTFNFETEAQSPELYNQELLERTMREPILNAKARRLGDKVKLITGNSVDAYKKAISGAGGMRPMPVVICMSLYRSLWTDYTRRTGWFSGSFASDVRQGGHAMLAVGYCDAPLVPGGGYIIVRNSWGKSWAWDYKYAGYARIPYSVIAKDAFVGALTIVESANSGASADDDDESIWFAPEKDPIEEYIKVAERDMRNRFGKFAIAKGKKIIVDPKTGKADLDTPSNRSLFTSNGYSWEG